MWRLLFTASGMSPSSPRRPPAEAAAAAAGRLFILVGAQIRQERLRRRWTLRELAARAGLSVGGAQAIEAGKAGSVDSYARLSEALGLRLEIGVVDPRRRQQSVGRQLDVVHAAMGEFEIGHFRPLGFRTAIDEPYQHFQFSGRADLVAWDADARALLHIENRTRFPDIQEAVGSFNAKRVYLGHVLAERFGIVSWRSETHAIVALWSAEVLHALRVHQETFRALAGGESAAFAGWWTGDPPTTGRQVCLVVLDPLASGRQGRFVGLDDALAVRPRHRGYADVARLLTRAA